MKIFSGRPVRRLVSAGNIYQPILKIRPGTGSSPDSMMMSGRNHMMGMRELELQTRVNMGARQDRQRH